MIAPEPELDASGRDVRLAPFQDLNVKRIPWEQRLPLIKKQFPSLSTLSWKKALDADVDLFARIMRDILKVDQAVPGRPGPRPALDYERGVKTLKQFMGEDYATLPFAESFAILVGGRSISHTANKTGLSRSQVHRLLHGDVEPDVAEMQQIAESFGKHPSYFLEYRTGYVTAHINAQLNAAPESSIAYYRKISGMVS